MEREGKENKVIWAMVMIVTTVFKGLQCEGTLWMTAELTKHYRISHLNLSTNRRVYPPLIIISSGNWLHSCDFKSTHTRAILTGSYTYMLKCIGKQDTAAHITYIQVPVASWCGQRNRSKSAVYTNTSIVQFLFVCLFAGVLSLWPSQTFKNKMSLARGNQPLGNDTVIFPNNSFENVSNFSKSFHTL